MSMPVIKILVFIVSSAAIVWVSRKSFGKPRTHGFYRFFAFELILVLILWNIEYWFHEPLRLTQLLSWVFLIASGYTVIYGAAQLAKVGIPSKDRIDPELIGIEKTTKLVTKGVYKYIRHPMYASLLFLTWGAWLKHVNWYLILPAILASIMLYLTAKAEERENIAYFGESYRDYMKKSRMFVPYIF